MDLSILYILVGVFCVVIVLRDAAGRPPND